MKSYCMNCGSGRRMKGVVLFRLRCGREALRGFCVRCGRGMLKILSSSST